MRNILKSFYLFIAPKGSSLYALTHNLVRQLLNFRYHIWVNQYDSYTDQDFERLGNEISTLPSRPIISVIMPVFNTNLAFLDQAIQSVRNQIYPNWELCISDDASTLSGVREIIQKHSQVDPRIKTIFREVNGHISAASNSALALATGEYVALLDHDDMLHPLALYYVVKEINEYPNSIVIFSDEDKLTARGKRIDPYFKPNFDIDLFLSQNMVSHLGVYKREAILNINGFREGLEGSQDYDLLLRILPNIKFSQIRHIPRILYHWRISDQSVAISIDVKPYALEAGRQALCNFLTSNHIKANVEIFENFGYKIKYCLSDPPPSVEIFLLTQKSIQEILEKSYSLIDAANYDISRLVLNISSVDIDKNDLYQAFSEKYPSLRVNITPTQKHDLSMLHQRVNASSAKFLAFIDDSCHQFSNGWLHSLISFADRPGIGSVSPKLIDKKGIILSCGLILNSENIAERLFNGASAAQLNYYFGWSSLHKGYSALPDKCLIINNSHFQSVGGFNDKLSDQTAKFIDLCLRMREEGLRNVIVPEVIVTLDRSKSIFVNPSTDAIKLSDKDKQYLLHFWQQWFENDPAFNPNLTIRKGKPIVAKEPRINYP